MPLNPRSVDFKKVCGNVSRSINCFRVLESRITQHATRCKKEPVSALHLIVRIASEPALPRDSTVPNAVGDDTRCWILLWQEDDKLIVRNLPDPNLQPCLFAFSFGSFCQVLVGVDQLIDPHGGHGTITAREYQCVLYKYIFLSLRLISLVPFCFWTPFALRPPSC